MAFLHVKEPLLGELHHAVPYWFFDTYCLLLCLHFFCLSLGQVSFSFNFCFCLFIHLAILSMLGHSGSFRSHATWDPRHPRHMYEELSLHPPGIRRIPAHPGSDETVCHRGGELSHIIFLFSFI